MRKSAVEEFAGEAPRSGRRAGPSRTRSAVLAAAQRQFAELGYDRTTLRSIAAEAQVDQKLVGYFFGSKQALFVAATELPFDPGVALPHVLGGDGDARGARLARLIVEMLESPVAGPRLIGLVRAAAAEPQAARMVRDLLARQIWGPAAAKLPVKDPALAVSLIASQVLGLVMARYVIQAEPLASMPADQIVDLMAPMLQQLLTADNAGGRYATTRATNR
jgi:AcrR family transcriptional regulator